MAGRRSPGGGAVVREAGLLGPALLLAGGRSRRMGTDKAALPWNGATLLESIAGVLAARFHPVVVVGGPPRTLPGLKFIPDDFPGEGPLGGLLTGLNFAGAAAFVCACDMPFADANCAALLWRRRGQADAAVPVTAAGPQPLFACYGGQSLAKLQHAWREGERSMRGALRRLDVAWVGDMELSDFKEACFRNANTPDDYADVLATAERELTKSKAIS